MEAQEKAYRSCIDGLKEELEASRAREITAVVVDKKVLEDAEKWRKLRREDPDATIDIYEEFDGAIEELNFLRDQLETIKKLHEEYGWLTTDELKEVLDKEFERSDDSILSRYLAVKTRLNKAIGGTSRSTTIEGEKWMNRDFCMRYYHAVCDALGYLED